MSDEHTTPRHTTPLKRLQSLAVNVVVQGRVTVAYTCVIVPDAIVEGFKKANTYLPKLKTIEEFLENEAKKGWGVIDPPGQNVNSFMIDD